MIGRILCFLGFHKPDEKNKELVEYSRCGKVYKSECLRCHVVMRGEEI